MSRILSLSAFLVLFPGVSNASGGDILGTIYLLLAGAGIGLLLPWFFLRLWSDRLIAMAASVLGAALAWWLTDDLPYSDNNFWINALSLAMPVAGSIAAIAALSLAGRFRKTESRSQRP